MKKGTKKLALLLIGLIIILGAILRHYNKPHSTIGLLSPLAQTQPSLIVIVREVQAEQSEKQEILHYIVEKFGDRAADLISIIRLCENSTFDQKRTNKNKDGSFDSGVAQVNSVHIGEYKECTNSLVTDWRSNIDCAKKVYDLQGISAWVCAKKVGIIK